MSVGPGVTVNAGIVVAVAKVAMLDSVSSISTAIATASSAASASANSWVLKTEMLFELA